MIDVTLEHVTKRFGDVRGVEDIHIRIRPGEFFTFLGPSGCGKTTTLRMVAGFYYPTSGRILFGSRDVTRLPPQRRNTGMVFQNYALFPHLTVFENIAFGLRVRKRPQAEIGERVERVQRLLGLAGLGERRIDQLSGGQQQRVALARALVIQPHILLLDEPLSNLDAKLREETRQEIKRLQLELGITTIYVTHDQAEAMAASDRIMVMQGGTVQQVGTPQEIYNRPVNRFVASFIGETNLVEGVVERIAGDRVWLRATPDVLLAGSVRNASPRCRLREGERTAVSIRPESIREAAEAEDRDDPGAETVIQGRVTLAEFTGVSVNYTVDAGGLTWKVLVVNAGGRIRERGEAIRLAIPPESLYFVE